MAYNDASATQHKGAYISFNGIRLRGVKDLSSFTLVGSVGQTPITTQESTGQEYEPTLPDAGTWSMTAQMEIFSPVYEALQESANNGSKRTLRVVYGARTAPAKITDGSGFKIVSGQTITSAFASGTFKVTITKANGADNLPAIAEGAYITKAGATTPATRITAINQTSAGAVEFTTDATSDISSTLTTSIDIIKPAVEATCQAFVSEFSHSAAVDGVVETTLTFQVTGTPVRTIGNPSITI